MTLFILSSRDFKGWGINEIIIKSKLKMLADGCDPNFVVTIIVFSRGFLSLKNQWKKRMIILICCIYFSYSFLKVFLAWEGWDLK